MRKPSPAATFLLALIVPTTMLARTNYDAQFRTCMQVAYQVREERMITALETYNRGYEASIRQRQADYAAAWTIEDDDSRNRALHDADRNHSQRDRDLRHNRKDIEREAKIDFSEQKNDCREQLHDRRENE